jgi:hypothetical protein
MATTCPIGHKNPDAQRFCGECGTQIERASEPQARVLLSTQIGSKLDDFEKGRIGLSEFQAFLDSAAESVPKVTQAPTRTAARSKTDAPTADGTGISPKSGTPAPPKSSKLAPPKSGTPGSPKPDKVTSPKPGKPASPVSNMPPLSDWPPNAEPYYRPSLFAAIAASVGVMLGGVGPWISAFIFTVNGLDAGNWGITALTLGAISGAALLAELFWQRTTFNPRWAVPLAWVPFVAGAACGGWAVSLLIRLMTVPTESVFGVPVGPSVGWGLWLLAMSSIVLCVAAWVVAKQISKSVDALNGQAVTRWAFNWQQAAIIASSLALVSGVGYIWTQRDNNPAGVKPPSPSQLPTFPSFPPMSPVTTTPSR